MFSDLDIALSERIITNDVSQTDALVCALAIALSTNPWRPHTRPPSPHHPGTSSLLTVLAGWPQNGNVAALNELNCGCAGESTFPKLAPFGFTGSRIILRA